MISAVDYFRQIGQIGACFGFMSLGLVLFDYAKPKWQRINTRNARFFTRLGYLSMTIYIFEGITALLIGKLLDLIPFLTGWADSMIFVISLGAVIAILWGLLLIAWEKISFTGSLEWIVISLNGLISGKRSQKFSKKRKEVELFQEPKQPSD